MNNSSPSPSRPLLSSPSISISIESLKTLQDTPHVSLDLERQGQEQAHFCPICIQSYPMKQIRTLLPCKHSFCSECLLEYLAIKINSNQILNIACPQSGCTEIFTDRAVQIALGSVIFFKYKTCFVKDRLALKSLQFHFCPDPCCSKPFTPVQNQKEPIQCSCGVKICSHCENFFHEGKSCQEAIDSAFMKYAKESGLKFCILCKTTVDRIAGSEDVSCSVCDYRWCWNCGNQAWIFHICSREWDPKLPSLFLNRGSSRVKRFWKENSVLKLILLTLFSPIILLGVILVFPVVLLYGFHLETSGKRPVRSFCLMLAALLGGIVLWIVGITSGWALVFLLASPYYLIRFLRNRRRQRWRAWDMQNFAPRNLNPSS